MDIFLWGMTLNSGVWTLDLLLEVWRNAGGGAGNEGQMGMGPGDGEVGQAASLKLDFNVLHSLLYDENRKRLKFLSSNVVRSGAYFVQFDL